MLKDLVIVSKNFSTRKKGERGIVIGILGNNSYLIEFKNKDRYNENTLIITSGSLTSADKTTFKNNNKKRNFSSSNNIDVVKNLMDRLVKVSKKNNINCSWNYYGNMKDDFRIVSSKLTEKENENFDVGILYSIPAVKPNTVKIKTIETNKGIKYEIILKKNFFSIS